MDIDEVDAITETIRHNQWDDRALIPECFQHALDTLRTIACDFVDVEPAKAAEQALRRMALRAVSGVPFDEPPHTLEHL